MAITTPFAIATVEVEVYQLQTDTNFSFIYASKHTHLKEQGAKVEL